MCDFVVNGENLLIIFCVHHVQCCTVFSEIISEITSRKDLMLEIQTVSQPRGKNPVTVLHYCHFTGVMFQLSVNENHFLLHYIFYSLNINSDSHNNSLQNSKITISILCSFFCHSSTRCVSLCECEAVTYIVLGFSYLDFLIPSNLWMFLLPQFLRSWPQTNFNVSVLCPSSVLVYR